MEFATRDVYTARITPDAETTRAVLDGMAQQNLGKWNDAENKQKFILTPTQQSATQQNQQSQWKAPVTGNSSKWLNKLRELRQQRSKRVNVGKVAELFIPFMYKVLSGLFSGGQG